MLLSKGWSVLRPGAKLNYCYNPKVFCYFYTTGDSVQKALPCR